MVACVRNEGELGICDNKQNDCLSFNRCDVHLNDIRYMALNKLYSSSYHFCVGKGIEKIQDVFVPY